MDKTDIVKLPTPDLVNNITAIRDLATAARVATHNRSIEVRRRFPLRLDLG